MDAALTAYDNAWRENAGGNRNETCQALADAYVLAHPELERAYGALTIPELVALVDLARAAGNEEKRILLDIWIMAGFEFQRIGGIGSYNPDEVPEAAIVPDGIRREIGGKQ